MTDEIAAKKKALRAEIKARRALLTGREVASMSAKIAGHLRALPEFKRAAVVHSYVAWQNEVRTQEIMRELLARGLRVIVPCINRTTRKLEHFQISDLADLQPGAFGIFEPKLEKRIRCELDEIDLVLVPAVAVDKNGNRLGYGGGYYDDFLEKLSATKVALVFSRQVVEEVPTRPEDQKVDIVVTEEGAVRSG